MCTCKIQQYWRLPKRQNVNFYPRHGVGQAYIGLEQRNRNREGDVASIMPKKKINK